MSKIWVRIFDLLLFAWFTYLATVSYGHGNTLTTLLYTLAAASMAAVIVIKVD